jgi:hypothetical protein
MTKPSTILVCPVVPLRQLPPAEREIVSRFLFQNIRGMDTKNDKRWRRFWSQLWQAEAGEGFQILSMEERGGPFHRRHRAILERLFQSQDRFGNIEKLHDWLKVGAAFVTWEPGKDQKLVAIPRSTAFEKCSENEMHEFHEDMVEYLHEPRAQRYLWKHLKPAARAEMVEAILSDHDEGAQHG